jgi:MFS family permease
MQVTGMGALVVTPIVGNLSDRYGRKALMTLPVTVAIAPLCKWSGAYFQHAWPAVQDITRHLCSDVDKLHLSCFFFFLAVILACGRSEVYFYVYYVAKIIAGVFCEGTMHCLCLAYVVKTTGRNHPRVTYIQCVYCQET